MEFIELESYDSGALTLLSVFQLPETPAISSVSVPGSLDSGLEIRAIIRNYGRREPI